jgi:Flp pilus assembly protein TadD
MDQTENLTEQIEQAKQLYRSGRSNAAFDLASKLVADYPGKTQVWLLRSFLYELQEDFDEAESDLTRAVQVNGLEPHVFTPEGECDT